ncbi:unnamed protein product [Oikopleura dioica]|uniref:tRNA-queuosine alpha-mannosyltransferase n=1 Tax=Oikopleura dioica TaxID=34765 RepID=E4XL90_OIKDI|nr:unnamed protein product [Oikopleura dioica]
MRKILIVEPFYERVSSFILPLRTGGSHKYLLDQLIPALKNSNFEVTLVTLPDKKWHWRARVSALQLRSKIPKSNFDVLLTSSVLPLAEFIGICPNLTAALKVIYFHENQLVYPVQEIKNRDVQYSYNQIMSALVADKLLFNSKWNFDSFLQNIPKIIKLVPDFKPAGLSEEIKAKSQVVHFPVKIPQLPTTKKSGPIHIVWAHRWEHDKNPSAFFRQLETIKSAFILSVLGECYEEKPKVFEDAKEKFKDKLVNFGFLPSKEDFYKVLESADIAVSTADHEFFGVSMVEAAILRCFPVAPNRLSYPELFPKRCLFNTESQLGKLLRNLVIGGREKLEKLNENIKEDVTRISEDKTDLKNIISALK